VDGKFTLSGGTIKNNKASSNGRISAYGTYTYNSGVVCGNTPTNSYETATTCPS
jgi:hypothetical protein